MNNRTAVAVEETFEETESFEETLVAATVVAVVLILILTIVIVVCIIRKTPSKPNNGRSNSLKKRVIHTVNEIYHKYWNVQDNDAPKGPRKADMPKAPLAMQGSINNEETAKEMLLKTNEDGCTYYESPCRSVASVDCHKHKHVQTHQTTLTAQTVLTTMTTP